MRGSSKILMALIAVMILAAPFARAGDDLGLPTDKTSRSAYQVVVFDGVIYRIATEIPCNLVFQQVDSEHHRLIIKPAGGIVMPYCEVVVQWGAFEAVTLGLVGGGSNSWILGIETGYAEK